MKIYFSGNKGRGMYVEVDETDYHSLSRFSWHLASKKDKCRGYAARRLPVSEGGRIVYMHRVISNPPPGLEVDHIDGDTFNNRRANLRNVTRMINCHNQKKKRGKTSNYVGVHWNKTNKEWRAQIRLHGITHDLGGFDNQDDAGEVVRVRREQFLREVFGEMQNKRV